MTDASIYPAHIRVSDDGFLVQTVAEHLEKTAIYAREALADIGLGHTAYLCGLLHDIGKFSASYKQYMIHIAQGKDVHRGSVNHTFAGVRYILDEFHEQPGFISTVSEFIAYAIGAHHGEFDCVAPDGKFGFLHRCNKNDPDIDEALSHFKQLVRQGIYDEIRSLMELATNEIKAALTSREHTRETRAFTSSFLARLLLSAVIEGDRQDTAEFMHDLTVPKYDTVSAFSNALAHTEAHLAAFDRGTPIQECRGRISDLCAQYGAKPGREHGMLSRLDIPTGGGKTLSSLRYALHRAAQAGQKRIIYVIPLLSILEQNAGEIRKAVGNDRIVFEHHSNVIRFEDDTELQNAELLAETWDSPILVTTLVQFLYTLFSHKTTSIRRFHSLTDSIILLDEVQTVPLKMLSLFNGAVEFLTKNCGADVVLCSATQPALESAQRPISNSKDNPILPIIPYDEALWTPFRRTQFRYYGGMDTESIVAFAEDALRSNDSLLLICNTKAVSTHLYSRLKDMDADVYSLSTNLCTAHRRNVLEQLRESLAKGRKTLCISTQVIEAGVDISFARVIRLLAGLDSLVQAAGRCNRNGEVPGLSEVSVIQCLDESLTMLPDIENGKRAAECILNNGVIGSELTSQETIRTYYDILYRDYSPTVDFQDYYVKDCDDTIYRLLSTNHKSLKTNSEYYLNQSFLTAGTHFEVFEKECDDIVVPYETGAELIAALYGDRANRDFAYQKKLIEAVKPYTVSIFPYQKEKLLKAGALHATPLGILTLSPDWYGEEGLLSDEKNTLWEV